jgi:hypothetical protein
MNDLKNLSGVEKIEFMFKEGVDFSPTHKKNINIRRFRLIKPRHLFWIPSLIIKKIYRFLPNLLKDIFFFLSINHKAPKTKMFAKTRYSEIRTLVDIKISALILKSVPVEILDKTKSILKLGFFTSRLESVSKIDTIIDDVLDYATPSHAGARPYFKDGKNEQIDGSYSAYYTFSKKDNEKITSILSKNFDKNFNYYLSALAGYRCKFQDIEYSLGIVYGANSNDEMHQDVYGSVAKGFIYLQDVGENDAPFELLKGSHLDAVFRSAETNKAVLKNDFHSGGSTRIRGEDLKNSIEKFGIKSFTGEKGTFIVANTAGFHRKGIHKSNKPRITLACGVKRKGLIAKLLINLLALLKNDKP